MNKKIVISVIVITVIAVAAAMVFSQTNNRTSQTAETADNIQNDAASIAPTAEEAAVKEFSLTSFYEIVDGQPKPQYSLKEITVNQGDKVRIKITVTKGTHNFNLDEFNIKADTPLNQEVTVEFTADKAGEFIYYCSIPGHRQNGHWGTLKVLAR